MLNLRSSLLFGCCVFCFVAFRLNAAFITYVVRRDEYFDITAVQRVQTRSAIECCTLCELDGDCSTINYNRKTSECALLPPRPQLRVDNVTRLNWTFYMKPELCEEDWVHFNQSCYLLVKEETDWHRADGHCMTLGAELVDIHSADELAFLSNYHKNNSVSKVWIGLNDISEEGSFHWSSGRPTTYTAYYPEEPNGGKDENCIETLDSTMWNDRLCNVSIAFICEKSAI